MKHTIVFYHKDCQDGFTAAWSAWTALGATAEYIPVAHGTPLPDVTDKTVYILDFCFPRAQLERGAKQAKFLRVIDHHKSSMDLLAGFEHAEFDMSRSGAGMAWDYFNPDMPRPPLVEHVEDRDLWVWKYPESKGFCRNLDRFAFDFEAWTKLSQMQRGDQAYLRAISFGEVLAEDELRLCRDIAKTALPIEVGGERGLIVNAPAHLGSTLGSLLAEQCGTFGVSWRMDGLRSYKTSWRSVRGFNLIPLVAPFGGGGHEQACGAVIDENLFQQLLDCTIK